MTAADGILVGFMTGDGLTILRLACDPNTSASDLEGLLDSIGAMQVHLEQSKTIAQRQLSSKPKSPKVNERLTGGPVNGSETCPEEVDGSAPRESDRSDEARQWRAKLNSLKQRTRSIARELEILRILHLSPHHMKLDDLMARLIKVGLASEDKRGTVVTQLQRMRADKALISSPYEAVYAITPSGRDHFVKFAAAYKDLMVPDCLH
jgi:hypothetical protein